MKDTIKYFCYIIGNYIDIVWCDKKNIFIIQSHVEQSCYTWSLDIKEVLTKSIMIL